MARETISVRLAPEIMERLRQEAMRRGESPALLAERLIDEGLRQRRHPLIRFVDGPAGRRARMLRGPDVWELVWFVQRSEDEDRVAHAARWFGLTTPDVEAAIAYYAEFGEEVDQRIRLNEGALRDAEAIAQGRSRLLGSR